MSESDPATNTTLIAPRVAALLSGAGRSSTFTLEPLPGGRNNRTYRVRADDGDSLLKWYFSHRHDQRDRLGTEFAFCRCLWRHGIRQIPQPLGADRTAGLGLYEFLDGKPLAATDVTLEHQTQAIAFLHDINAARSASDAVSLPEASEACFSLAAHVARIDQRVTRLADVTPEDELGQEMHDFVRHALRPAFEQFRERLTREAPRGGWDPQASLSADDRILSPSDFGFHNALLQNDGSLRFVDFEYAGWDDPAKLVGDFFCQVEVPARAEGFDRFLSGVAQLVSNPEALRQRVGCLFPLYQLKWCCIVLNVFLPTGDARRTFSASTGAASQRAEQLALARRLLAHVGCNPGSA